MDAALQERRARLMVEIQIAFAGVSRIDGVSWSESIVADGFPEHQELVAGRLKEHD